MAESLPVPPAPPRYQERHDVIQYYGTHGMAATLSKKDHIAGMVSTTGTAKQRSWRRLGAGTTLSQETEEMLVRWVHDMRKDGVPVTHAMLQLMALEAAVDEGYSEVVVGLHK
ncbi:hypothetical protein H257_02246 [Aphanomyces astaci]|uniref:HTH CENPB-type domain-containing protein n=1 Tax=Aphanomyces astaci TaxID=112090 RepID=W4H166_APHAT|nr:hypothetical protein H257_02246 [Aphanomyces astaci]ETV85627.1 hypothetical protein H257_02246 [Aphanomyces astaci]|eukprot:XP_009824099.1 hypothetical protein H257_02246 [Aphanomyces astaci]